MLVSKGPDASAKSVRLDTTEESVKDMDLSDVKCKVIQQYQVVYEISLEAEVILKVKMMGIEDEVILKVKMMSIPWEEFQWEYSDRCHERQVDNNKVLATTTRGSMRYKGLCGRCQPTEER